MSTFPTTIPSYSPFSTPITLMAMQHTSRHHQMEQDIVAIATKVGITSSPDGSSLDKKLSDLTSAAATKTGAETLTNKTIGTGSSIASTVDVTEVLKKVYPVGSLYFNAAASTNPATLLGFGTWSQYASGRVLVGLDSGQAEFDTLEETGGAKTHALTAAETGPHTHDVVYGTGTAGSGAGNFSAVRFDAGASTHTTTSAGAGDPHNNLQPYIVVYIWKRTA